MQNIDFNDLLVKQGVQAVRAQLQPAIDQALGAPIIQVVPSKLPADSEYLKGDLARYAIIVDIGKMTNKVYDTEAKLEMTKTQFNNKVGKKRANDWFAHDHKTISRAEVDAERQKSTDKSIGNMIDRYYYIDTTEEAWDMNKKQRVKLTAVKHKNPVNYETWYKSPSRKEIEPDNIWFDPTGDRRPEDPNEPYANSYRGLPIEPADNLTHAESAEIAKPVIDLLVHLCNGDMDDVNWVLNWLAMPLQKVGTKMDTSLIFHGRTQGAGKSLFFGGVMGAIYGNYALTLGQSQLEGQYNDWVDGKLWAIFEEIFAGNDRYQNMGMVKQLITGSEIYINKKFMSGWKQENHVNCVFLSNEMMPLAVESDDRRMFVVRPMAKCPSSLSDAVGKAIHDPKKTVIKAFLQFLLTKDLGDQSAHNEARMTKAKQDLICLASSSWERFVNEWMSGYLPQPFGTCLAKDLYYAYKKWCENNGEKATSMNKFLSFVKQIPNISTYRSWYQDKKAGGRRQNTFIVIGQLPSANIENHFTVCHNAYHDALGDMTDVFSPIQPSQYKNNRQY